MKRVHVLEFTTGLPQTALASLEAHDGAAWVIDVEGGRILASTVKGAALLGLVGGASAPLIDASTPALARLRALAVQPPANDDRTWEILVFWTRTGTVRPRCRVQFLDGDTRSLALVAAPFEAAPVRPSTAPLPLPADGDVSASLEEIARRIREGPIDITRRRPPRDEAEESEPTAKADAPAAPSDAPVTGTEPETTPDPAPAAEPEAAPRDALDRTVSVSERASLAHELKTPLSAIAAAAEIMKDERFGPLGASRYVDYATDILSSAVHMLTIIDRMLAEGGTHHDLNFVEIDPGAVLTAAVSELTPLAERAGIGLALELEPSLPHIVADATSLRQMVFNLVTNALKFTNRGGQVTVAVRYSVDGPLAISVADTGHGMTRADIDRLLDTRFTSGAHKQNGQNGSHGLGLGLPLVKALATANGAELVIDSAPGLGTTASVVFKKERVIPV
ncbi:MAG: sensor histidine kinase [Hyphomicrobium sp.]|uniref:sensor histidine kinase n=1 Tax=Hyphomicrobium sp. TaxID=82 RepID=UPI003D0D77FF